MNNGLLLEKELEYKNYILNHIENIKKCFDIYNKQLCNQLEIDNMELYKLIIIHDQSKFSKEEFNLYRQYFYPVANEIKNQDLFDIGWLMHQNSNKHHPEFWIMRNDNKTTVLDMPNIYIAEMTLDWAAMGLNFKDNAYNYYHAQGYKKPLSNNTKNTLDKIIKIYI